MTSAAFSKYLTGSVKIKTSFDENSSFEEFFENGLADGTWGGYIDGYNVIRELKFDNGFVHGDCFFKLEKNDTYFNLYDSYEMGKLINIQVKTNNPGDFKLSDYIIENASQIIKLEDRLYYIMNNLDTISSVILTFNDEEPINLDERTLISFLE